MGKVPRGIALAPDGKRFYVTNSWTDTVTEIDTASLQVLRTLPAGFEPTGVAMDAARNVLYVANRLSDDISVIDLARGATCSGWWRAGAPAICRVARRRAHLCHPHLPELGQVPRAPESEITEIDTGQQMVARSSARCTTPPASSTSRCRGTAARQSPPNCGPRT